MRGEPRERERVIPLLARMLLMLAACNVVRATAVHVVLVRSGPYVAVEDVSLTVRSMRVRRPIK